MDRYLGACCSLTIIILVMIWSRVNSFNLDVDYPIIYEDHPDSNQRRYFGYSLGMYSVSNKSWILIGAPRANYTNPRYSSIQEPGVVYQCSLSSLGQCDPIDLFSDGQYQIPGENSFDDTDEEDLDSDKPYSDKPYPDKGFMGGSMVIQGGPKGRLAICGPKTSFKFDVGKGKIIGQLGYCFWRYLEDDDLQPISPFVSASTESDKAKSSPFGASGFSVAMTEPKNSTGQRRLLFGVPGFENHQGAISIIRDFNGTDNARQRRGIYASDFSRFLGFFPLGKINKKAVDGYDLFGYQVAVGVKGIRKRLLFVVSAPRANHLKGMVSSFYINRDLQPEKIENYPGLQIGEYYGASIATGDLNEDGSDDIIVGAPFYAVENNGQRKAVDEGRVEVILKKFNIQKLHLIGKVAGGRFGYAVSFLGKLCPNEPAKIGVSAPNEDEGKGVVYIYAYDDGELKETQRLVARSLYHKLEGFGSYIITYPSDIDGNKVEDIAVGAYKSGHAVVFRGKPVVKWNTRLLPNRETISLNSTSFSFKSCILFDGMDYIEKVVVERVLHLDPGYQRCHLNGKTSDTAVIIVHQWKELCEEFSVTFKEHIKDFQPLVVAVNFNLKEEKRNKTHVLVSGGKVTGYDNFCNRCPTTKPINPLKKEYPFSHDCGDDNICRSDLVVDGSFPILSETSDGNSVPFLVGSYQDLELTISVLNKKDSEKSYKPSVTIALPSGIDIQQIHHSECEKVDSPEENCDFHYGMSNQIYVRCDVAGELAPSKEEIVEISLDLSNLNGSAAENITVCASSASQEVNNTDNIKSIPIHFEYIADITITGHTKHEQFNFNDKKATEEDFININHIYEVQKFGVSPVEEVIIEIFVPYAMEDDNGKIIEFLNLKLEGSQNGESLSCGSLLMDNGHRRKRSVEEDNTSEVNLKNMTAAQAPSNRTLYLNCSSLLRGDHHKIKCRKVNCTSLPLHDDQDIAKVELYMELDTASLKKAKKEKDIILLETLGKVGVIKPKVLKHAEKDRPDLMWTSTMFIGDIPAGKVPIWIIILAIIAGILLLALMGFGLYKAGFFERKKKEELDSLKNQISTDNEFAVDSTE